ncbi:LacI family DNA-binding transcriptional regulator [Leptothrix discophora]|uniref:LacI family DNA-binding transcriptional regulator n=1 Tax=Leptothrix discophora TaxID=89 RepID=A0ABT9G4S8_LEPDI|nr:LacI family DNA-binding transcriptional regulator [Leptothrix discophora]MDP4301425.1 LacI family DNA-binding transcriptional regulator [Leptothrix discophora]
MSRDPSSTRKITASDVAERVGVSKWTVSRAFTDGASIAPDVRERVLQAAAEMGYSPNLLARSLTTRSSRLVALVVDELGNPNQLFLINEATRQLQARGFSSLLLNLSPEYGPAAALRLADQFQVDGIMFMGTSLNQELIELAQKIRRVPLVVVSRNSSLSNIPFVTTDGYAAGAEIADLFLSQGLRRIGHMTGPASERTELRRLDGFRDRLEACGVPLACVLHADHYRRDQAMQALLKYLGATPREQRIEALFCESDILAIGALDALHSTGNLHRLAVVGFDDIEMASAPPYQLTTFRQPVDHLVAEAIRRILDPDALDAGSLLAPGTLVLRGSHRRLG